MREQTIGEAAGEFIEAMKSYPSGRKVGQYDRKLKAKKKQPKTHPFKSFIGTPKFKL